MKAFGAKIFYRFNVLNRIFLFIYPLCLLSRKNSYPIARIYVIIGEINFFPIKGAPMNELELLRNDLDTLDRKLMELFEQRMELTKKVGQYKKDHNIGALDTTYEKELLKRRLLLIDDPLRRADVTNLYEAIMSISRRQQRRIINENKRAAAYQGYLKSLSEYRNPVEDPRVVYQGEPGAYSEMAALDFFGSKTSAKGLYQFEDTFKALKNGEADYAVLPIENSSTGAIRQVYDLLAQYECYLVGETTVNVSHSLMALPGVSIEDITTVYSHEQGLFQCEQFLDQHRDWRQKAQPDTAGSAKKVAETQDRHAAAICSPRSAEIYGLNILAEGVNQNSNNTTRFVVVSPKMELRNGGDKICISFTTPHESGSLQEVLTIFTVNNLNLVKLESRPIPERNWEYMFFVEFTGNLAAPGMNAIIRDLIQITNDLRVFGNFKANLE